MTVAVLGAYDLGGLALLFLFIYGVARIRDRKLTFGFGKGSITIEDLHSEVAKIGQTVGDKNGGSDLATMLAKVRDEQEQVKRDLAERTLILRDGATEAEDIGAYTQARMHDVLEAIARVEMKVDTLWRVLAKDYELPDLQSIKEKAP